MADINVKVQTLLLAQTGLSYGTNVTMPGAAVWRRLRLQPFNVTSTDAPRPDECQIWPRGLPKSDTTTT